MGEHREGAQEIPKIVFYCIVSLYESFGVYGGEQVRAFEKLMWPEHGKPGFCEVLNSVTAKILELHKLLLRMIFESFGLKDYYKSTALEVFSNERLHAVKHRVMMTSDKDRYSGGFFSLPKDGVGIEVPQELVDNDHPLLYRPFVYSEYLAKHLTNVSPDALQVYAGI